MQDIRNIAIIAHVDHGKTTLVDKMMLAGNLFREGQNLSSQVLDANDLERERGITILSKNVSINWKGTKINIIDTPGHSDFGGEVERVLNMADGCLLLVDAFEGPMPQTRFVLQKALQIGLKPIVVVNKVDKPNCRPEEVYEMVFDLMFSLNATEDQLDFPVVYGSAKNGWMSEDFNKPTTDITYLLDKIVEVIPAPQQLEGTPQMLITSLDYSSYTGRIAVGRVHRGTLRDGQQVTIAHRDGTMEKTKIKELHTFEGMGHVRTDSVDCGDRLDYGSVMAGETCTRTFIVTNKGKNTLAIRRLWCPEKGITAVIDRQEVKRGKKATVTVTVDTSQMDGDLLNVPLTLLSNDPAAPSLNVRLVGFIDKQ